MEIDTLVNKLLSMILNREIIEISARDEDVSLSGMMVLLKTLFEKFPAALEKNKDKIKFLHYLIHDCLFNKDTKT